MSIGIDLERFENFKDAEFRSLEVLSSEQLKITFAVQDKAREFDWITLSLEFSGITDAKQSSPNKMSSTIPEPIRRAKNTYEATQQK